MDDLFLKRMNLLGTSIGDSIRYNSDLIMNSAFTHDPQYRKSNLYDWNMNFLEEVDIKFQTFTEFSILKDKVEHKVQFRPKYHPEKIYIDESIGLERFGYYLDIPDDDGIINTWLIVGRNDKLTYPRYNVLKCNWIFQWIVNQTIYKCLGVLRMRSSYNSGEWSDGIFTKAENQDSFWLPQNTITETIDYNMRFMPSTNKKHPLVYHVSKREETYPVGIFRFTMSQDMFDTTRDNKELMIADYYSNNILPQPSSPSPSNIRSKIICSGKDTKLRIGGSFKALTGSFYNNKNEEIFIKGKWKLELDENEQKYFSIEENIVDSISTLKIRANLNCPFNTIVKVIFSDIDSNYSSTILLEAVG